MSKRLRQKPEVAASVAPTRRRKALLAKPVAKPVKAPRTLLVGAASIASVLILLLLLGAWGAGMTFMLLFGDHMSQTLIVQNSEMQDAYEQRLLAFRAEIARLSFEMEQSKFDANSIEGRVIELGRRQRQIESRLVALNRLSDLVAPGAVSGPPTLTAPGAQPQPANVPVPPSRGSPTQLKGGALELRDMPVPAERIIRGLYDAAPPLIQLAQLGAPPAVEQDLTQAPSDLEVFIGRMETALQRADRSEVTALGTMVRLSETRIDRFKAALREIGMSPDEAMQQHGRGEPNIPAIVLATSEQTGPFADGIGRVRQNFGLMHKMRYLLEALPTSKPTLTEVRYSSPFGFRFHPILHIQKLHGGIDMAAPVGTQVRAAGSGVVLSASWGGGYGNLIQIDHGNDIISRYAHLSEIDVVAGQPVSPGMFIGKSGSTGASTGPHLHFETRIHNVPVNPACFMLAGDKMTGQQTMPLPCDVRPVWEKHTSDDEEDDDS